MDAVCDGHQVFLPGIMELVERTGVHSGDSTSVYPPFSIPQSVKDTIADYTTRLGLGIGIVGLFNIQFIVDSSNRVFVIEVNPRASRSVPFLSKSTGDNLVRIATRAMLRIACGAGHHGHDPAGAELVVCQGACLLLRQADRHGRVPLPGNEVHGEAIGYDRRLNRALYKALKASGVRMKDYGTVIVTIADEDKEEALPLVRRFYRLGFNIEATLGTAMFLKQHGIRTRIRGKISDGSEEIWIPSVCWLCQLYHQHPRHFSGVHYEDGVAIRRCAVQNGVTTFTSRYHPHRPGRAGGVHPGNLHHRRGEEREMTASPRLPFPAGGGIFCPRRGACPVGCLPDSLPPLYPAGGVPGWSPAAPPLAFRFLPPIFCPFPWRGRG